MPEGENQEVQLSEETLRLAELGRQNRAPDEASEKTDEVTDKGGNDKPQRPDHVPEKFWDAEKGELNTEALLRSYGELEKMKGKVEETPPGDGEVDKTEDDGAKDDVDKGADEAPTSDVGQAMQDAETAYAANNGELPEENRKALNKAGITDKMIDAYLAGVKAQEAALANAVYDLAGGEEAYKAAASWANENWSKEEIAAFDTSLGGQGMKIAVAGLMAQYHAENPGEGRLTATTTGGETGAVYHDKSEFLKDLREADEKGDAAARKAAVTKLERSKKAGTLVSVTPRPNRPFRR